MYILLALIFGGMAVFYFYKAYEISKNKKDQNDDHKDR